MKNPRTFTQLAGKYLSPFLGAIVLSILVYMFFNKDRTRLSSASTLSNTSIDVQCGDDLPGRMETINQRDTFRMELQAGDSLRIQMRFIFPGYTEQIILQHPDGTPLDTALTDPNSGMAVLTYPIDEDGRYTVLASEETGRIPNNSPNDYGISFQVTNDPNCAQLVNCGEDLEAELGEFAEMDTYAIPLRAGDDLQVRLKFILDNFRKEIVLHHPDGTPLTTVRVGPDEGLAILHYTIPEDGTYLVRISEERGEWARVYGVSFQVTNDPDCAQPADCSDDLFRNISKLAQTDMYAIPLQDNDLLRVQMKFTFGSYVEQLILYAPDGAPLASALADPSSGMATLIYTPTEDGTYFLLATEENGEWAESYGLSIQVLNNPPCAVTVACGDDLVRDINQRAKQDAFHLLLQAGDQLRIQMRFNFDSYTEVLHLYDANGRRVAEATIDPVTGMALLTYNVEVTGDYTVLATEQNGESARGYGISFQVLNQTACSEQLTDRCIENEYSLALPSEMDGYSFSASSDDVLFLEVDANAREAEPVIYLYNERGELLTQSTPAPDQSVLIEDFLITEAGDYHLLITDALGQGFGAYTLTYNLVSPELQQAVALMLNDVALCVGDTLEVDLSLPGVSYQWSTGDTSARVSINRPGNYQVVMDVNGCEITRAFSVRSEICSPVDLCGIWIGQNYECLPGAPSIEVLEVTDSSGHLTATRFVGDDCLDRGLERWTGFFDQNPFSISFSSGALEDAFIVNENRIDILGQDLYFTRAGCDEMDSLGLNLFDLTLDCIDCGIFDTVRVDLCKGDTYRGVRPVRDTTLQQFVRVDAGLDSFLTVQLSIQDTALVFQQIDLCAGDAILVGDSLVSSPGRYRQVLSTATGCDSTVITDVAIRSIIADTIDVQLCPGDSLLVGSSFVKTPGLYPDTLTAGAGCDSILFSDVQFRTILSDTIKVQLCPGDSLLIGSSFVKVSGLYPDTLTARNGCDSILVSNVRFKTILSDTIQVQLCPGDSLLIGSSFVKTPGLYRDTLTAIAGCDSILVSEVQLPIIPSDTIDVQLCPGDSLLIGSSFVKAPGLYRDTLTAIAGCDSLLVSNVLFRTIPSDTLDVQLCPGDSLLIGGSFVKAPGLYPDTLAASTGCDSILISNIVFRTIPSDTLEVQLCPGDSLLIGSSFVKAPGLYRDTLTAAAGCDRILLSDVRFRTVPADTIDVQLCPGDSLLIGHTLVKTPGLYPDTLTASVGCDSILVRNIRFSTIPTDTIVVQLCPGDSLLIGPAFVKVPGLYSDTLTANTGCDRILVNDVQFRSILSDTIDVQLCPGDSLLIGSTYVKAPGPYRETFTATNGCDSIRTYDLSFYKSYRDTLSFDLCPGETFTVDTFRFESDTTFCRTLPTVAGCDSLLCYQLTFRPSILTSEERIICANEEIIIDGQVINSTTSICLEYQTIDGCDSTHCINVTVLDTVLVKLQAAICSGDRYQLGNDSYTESGIYTATFARSNNCDSTVVLDLSVLDAPNATIEIVGGSDPCASLPAQLDAGVSSSAYRWSTGDTTRQIEVTEAGLYNVRTTNDQGCTGTASIEIEDSQPLSANIISLMSYNGFPVSCPNSTDAVLEVEVRGGLAPYQYLWNTGVNTKRIENIPVGSYEVTVTDAKGCSVTRPFEVLSPPALIVEVSIKEPSCIDKPDGAIDVLVTEGVTGPYLYSLTNTGFQTSPRFSNLPAGKYQLQVQDINGCEQSQEVQLSAPASINLTFPQEQLTVIAGDSIQLTPMADFPVDTFYWEPAIPNCKENCFNPIIRPTGNGAYTLTATTADGCSTSANISIRIETADDLYIPNAFSPNGDGENDLFNIYARHTVARVLSFRIFSRWGDLIFEEKDFTPHTNRGWDGRHGAQPLNAGVFIYQVLYEKTNGEQSSMAGDVVLIR